MFPINILSFRSRGKSDCFFALNRHLLPLLFTSASGAILDWAETEGFLPGVVVVMHTFGAKLNFNCHLHVLYTLGGYSAKSGKWKARDFVSAESLKKRFKTILLAELRSAYTSGQMKITDDIRKLWKKEFGSDEFWHVQNALWKKEWYLWVGEKLDNVIHTVKYIGRYAKRPCLAETKILYYSKLEHIVRFEYKDKITKTHQTMDVTPIEFIGLLIQHIPEKNFHMIRYYGAYANARKNKIYNLVVKQITALFGFAKLLFELTPAKIKTWRERTTERTGIDPLKCQVCNLTMSLVRIGYRTRDGTFKIVDLFR